MLVPKYAEDVSQVYGWGMNGKGQCGQGTREAITKPKLMKGEVLNKYVVQVAAGQSHSLVLCRTGELYGCGDGRVGNGDVTGCLIPKNITHIYGAPIIKVSSCGSGQHSVVLTSGGVCWSW